MGAFGVDLGTGESFNETTYPAAAAAQGENATGITLVYASLLEEQVLVAKLVHIFVHYNTDMDYHILVVASKHL